jgi:molybdopterin-guanine dinucleotide biosynthesis protein A
VKVLIDALILAGGRSSRLDSVAKARLKYRNQTLLERTVAAVAGLRNTVVVGDVTEQTLPPQLLVAREDPPFGGPAAGIGAGLVRLAAADPIVSDYTLVLACDMPNIGAAVPLLLSAVANDDVDDDSANDDDATSAATADDSAGGNGLIAIDSQHRLQPLAAAYRTTALLDAVARQQRAGSLHGLSVCQLIRELSLREITVPDGATSDIDTWADAANWGIEHPPLSTV